MIDQQAAEYLQSRGIRDLSVIEASEATLEGGRVWLPWLDEQGREEYRSGRALNGSGSKYKNAEGPRPALYGTPGAWMAPEVILVEGQIDALAALSATGVPAFAAAGSSLSDEAVRILEVKETVTVVPDGKNGTRLLEEATSRLSGRIRLRVGRLPEGFEDVADLAARAENEDVAEVLTKAQEVEPSRSSWGAVDLGPVLRGEVVDGPPAILTRSDGSAVLYAGKLHTFHGETESLKSWLGLAACREQIEADRHVLYLDFEDSAPGIVFRLLALGAFPERVASHFHYVRPEERLEAENRQDLDELLRLGPSLVILDGVTEAMALQGFDPISNRDVAEFIAVLPRPLTATGAAVVLIDHVPKAKEARGRFAFGAQHKLAGIDGAGLRFELVAPFGRGQDGIARVTVAKDRPGWVRAVAEGATRLGEVHLCSEEDGRVSLELRPPAHRDSTLGPAATRVLALLRGPEEPQTVSELQEATAHDGGPYPLKRTTIQDALNELAAEGLADGEKPGNGRPNRWWKT